MARSRGNVNISDRFIGTTDLWGWATRPYFRVAPTRLHPQKHGNPEITSPAEHGTRQHGISPTNYISLTEGAVNHGMPNIWNQIPNYETRYVTSVPVTIGQHTLICVRPGPRRSNEGGRRADNIQPTPSEQLISFTNLSLSASLKLGLCILTFLVTVSFVLNVFQNHRN